MAVLYIKVFPRYVVHKQLEICEFPMISAPGM